MVDIGETAYAMVLADDLDGNGMLDLLLATMNGNIYAFQTAMPATPQSIWPSQVHFSQMQLSLCSARFQSSKGFCKCPTDPSGLSRDHSNLIHVLLDGSKYAYCTLRYVHFDNLSMLLDQKEANQQGIMANALSIRMGQSPYLPKNTLYHTLLSS